jgi:hypothetical protein
VGACLFAGCAPAPPAVRVPPPVLAVRATAKVPAPCGPDYLERHATSVSDLDGNGTLDRVGITREADAIVVRLYEHSTLRETARWKLVPANGYLEVATPRRRGSTRGDLWITVGANGDKPWDGSAAPWNETLYHLEAGALAPVTSGYRDMRIHVDVDGDGRVDPIGSGGAVRALVAGDRWFELPVILSSHVHGVPTAPGQEEAADLDGNGVRELVVEHEDAIEIVEVPSLRVVWSAKGHPWKPSLVRWAGAWVLAVRLDDKLRVYKTDASHALVADYPDAPSYADVVATVGAQLVMHSHPWQVFDRANPATPLGAIEELVRRLDDPAAPVGPLRLAAGDAPGFVTIHREPLRELSVVLVDPGTRAPRRLVWRSEPLGMEEDLQVSLIDLDRDGASELLLEFTTMAREHHGADWNSSRMRIVDGQGQLVWEEPRARGEEWIYEDGYSGRRRQTLVDGTHVRAFDLGDGTMPLRVRSAHDEYYLLAASSKIQSVPACLE